MSDESDEVPVTITDEGELPFLQIYNAHFESCGTPPDLTNYTVDEYTGYFENSYGEQWVFKRDLNTGTATLYGGDVGWDEPEVFDNLNTLDLYLDKDEKFWFGACWTASQRMVDSREHRKSKSTSVLKES